jgi:hypothetical protein
MPPGHKAVRSVEFDCVQDLSDIQWRQFREGLPLAAAAMAGFAAASRAVNALPRMLACCHTTKLCDILGVTHF